MATIMASGAGLAVAATLASLLGASAYAIDSAVATPAPASSLPGAYSLSYDKDKWSDEYSVFRMSVAEPIGTVGADFAASDDPRLRPLTRLNSSWAATAPWLGLPMRLGDGVSSVGFWDQPVRTGGMQIGTFQPKVPDVTAPPSQVAVPYEIIGPNMVASTRFIDHLRTLVQLQKQTLETVGQGDFSIESGRLRDNFETRSADYGAWMTSGTYRYGLSPSTTIDGQIAQVSGQQSFLGVGLLEGLGPLGLVSAKVASSRDTDSTGWLARMGYDFSRDRLSIALRSHIQSPGFQDVGDSSVIESFKQRTLASARVDLGSLGKVSLASASETYADDSRRDIVALSHAVPFGGGGILSTAAAYSPGPGGTSALLVSFTYPFDYIAAPAHKINGEMNTALDRTIVDAFGQTRIPTPGRGPGDKLFAE